MQIILRNVELSFYRLEKLNFSGLVNLSGDIQFAMRKNNDCTRCRELKHRTDGTMVITQNAKKFFFAERGTGW